MSVTNVRVVQHQRPDPVADAAAYRLHRHGRRHIETRIADDGRTESSEWWWEPDVRECDPASRPRDAS